MGLEKQHSAQQMCLARTRDFYVAGCVAKAAANYAGENVVLTRADGADEKVVPMLDAWASVCQELGLVERVPCALMTLTPTSEEITQAMEAQTLDECMPLLQLLLPLLLAAHPTTRFSTLSPASLQRLRSLEQHLMSTKHD